MGGVPENPRILLTNDDGVHAPGLAVLREIAETLSDDVWVVAPDAEMSGASRALSLHAPLRVREHEKRVFSVLGTPTDCVVMGVLELVEGKKPDLVLSGVNRGQNLAEDVTLSGTVAGALQGMALGIPSIALSQSYGLGGRTSAPWETARAHAPGVLDVILKAGWPDNVVVNVNFPPVPADEVRETRVTTLGRRDSWHIKTEKRMDLRGGDYYWLGFHGTKSTAHPGTDLTAMYEGAISVTPIHLDLTHEAAKARLAEAFQG